MTERKQLVPRRKTVPFRICTLFARMEHPHEHHERRIVGDIIAHVFIGAWMIAVGISVAIQACNAKSIATLRSSRKTALFPSVSGTLFWAFIAAYQIIIAMFRGIMKPTWLDHIEIATVLSLSFLVHYLHITGTLTESIWILAEPVGVCTMAVTLGVRFDICSISILVRKEFSLSH